MRSIGPDVQNEAAAGAIPGADGLRFPAGCRTLPASMKVLLCIALAWCALPRAWSEAETQAPRQPAVFELSSEMLRFSDPPTELFLDWQRDANSGLHAGLDALEAAWQLDAPDRQLERAGLLSAFTGAGLIINQAFSLTAHDVRHMEAARAIGGTNVGLVTPAGASMSIWQFFLESFNFTGEPGLYIYDGPPGMAPAEEARVAGAGLDTNLLTAASVSRRIDEGEGHVTDLAPYLLNKLWGISYFLETGPTSDAANYMTLLQAQGASTVTQSTVIALQAASCLLSGGFLSLARGAWVYVWDGDARVQPLALAMGPWQVFWPEATTWLNADNVSVQVTLDAAWDQRVLLRAGADVPVLSAGAAGSEVTLGAAYRIEAARLGVEVTTGFSGVPFLLGTAEFSNARGFAVGLEGYYGNGDTMREAREHPLGPGGSVFVRAAL